MEQRDGGIQGPLDEGDEGESCLRQINFPVMMPVGAVREGVE